MKRLTGDRGSTLPLMILYFMVAGLLATGGVVASAAFLAQRDLQSICDGAAVAGANGFVRAGADMDQLEFERDTAHQAIDEYVVAAAGGEASDLTASVEVDGDRVIVTCSRTAHVPFEAVFDPDGVQQTATAAVEAPLLG